MYERSQVHASASRPIESKDGNLTPIIRRGSVSIRALIKRVVMSTRRKAGTIRDILVRRMSSITKTNAF